MNHHDAAKALELLKKAESFDRVCRRFAIHGPPRCSLAGRSDDAAQEFRALLGLKGFTLTDPTFPLAQLGLARLW